MHAHTHMHIYMHAHTHTHKHTLIDTAALPIPFLSNTIYAICLSPAALSRGHPGLSSDVTVVGVWLTEHMAILFSSVLASHLPHFMATREAGEHVLELRRILQD